MSNYFSSNNSRNDICANCSSNSSSAELEGKCSTALPSLLLVVGLIEGILSLVLLSQKSLRQLPLRSSLLMLCVSSSVLLLLSMPRFAIMCANQVDIRRYSLISCFVHRFLTDMMLQLSTTTVAFISLERYLAVVYPYLIPQTRIKVERIGLLSILTFSVLLNSHYFFTMDKVAYETGSAESAKQFHCHVNQYYAKWVLLLMSFVQTYIPFLVILLSNVSLIRRLYALKRKRAANRIKVSSCSNSSSSKCIIKSSRINQKRRCLLVENEKVAAEKMNLFTTNADNQIEVIEMNDVKQVLNGREHTRVQDRNNRCSREAKVAQLILIITVSFLFFHMPYECYNLLLKHEVVRRSISPVDLWVVFVYMTYCYQLFVFPIYILYHPVIRAQLFTWFVNNVNRHENTEKISISKQRSDNIPR